MKRDRSKQNPGYLPPKKGEPPLHCAARVGDHESVRRLVGEGVDVNQPFNLALDPGGRDMLATPLMVAAGSGYGATVETMRLLLELGADPKIHFQNGSIARFAAGGLGWNYLPGGDGARLALCLELGCDPNEIDERGVTLLAEVAENGDAERVKALLKAGASPNAAPNAADYTSLKKFPINLPFRNDAPMAFQIPLHGAVDSDDLEMVDLLLKAGADIGVKDWEGKTALFSAQSPEIAKRLIQAGLSLEEPALNGWVPLVLAISNGSVLGVETFLSVGANIHHVHDHGYTVFMHALGSMERNMEIINLLLKAGVDPLAVSDYGWNAFHAALVDDDMNQNSEEFVRTLFGLLLKLGVDINHKTKNGVTPLAMAKERGLEIEERILLQLGAQPS